MSQKLRSLLGHRVLLSAVLLIILCLALPVYAHVPVSADGNNEISTALTIEKPTKSYVIYGHLHEAGEAAYYQLRMNPDERLVLSLMTTGFNAPVPDMIILSPENAWRDEGLPHMVTIPEGYGAVIIRGVQPQKAEYEPFSPVALYNAATFSKDIRAPGTYYVAVVSPADETRYSMAIGYVEEFTPSEWILVPINVISTHLREGQSVLSVFSPFLAVVVLGFIVIARREQRSGSHLTLSGWLARAAGLCYLGGAAITFTQMVRALGVTGPSPAGALTLILVIIPVALGTLAMQIGAITPRKTLKERIFLVLIGVLGLTFWAGLIIGPVLVIGAAALPDRSPSPRQSGE